MTNEEVLNLILAHDCPSNSDGDVREFELELCCKRIQIKAKLIKDDEPFEYEIMEVTVKEKFLK